MVRCRLWSALSCVSAPGSLYHPVLWGQELVSTQSFQVADCVRKRVIGQPSSLWAPQQRHSFLCGSELREQIVCHLFFIFISCSIDLCACFVLIYVCVKFLCTRSLAGCSRILLWTFQTQSQVSLKTFEFVQIFILAGTSFIRSEVPTD